MSVTEGLPWRVLSVAAVLVVAVCVALVSVLVSDDAPIDEAPVTTSTVPGDSLEIAADCEEAFAPARAFMAAHPAGSRLTSAEGDEIRALAAEAYNVCSPADMWALRTYELFPWAQSLGEPLGAQ